MNPTGEYPQFISNKPCGKDMFLGESQKRIAKAIATHIKDEENSSFSHLIGLEGSWGAGKSNLIKILKNEYLEDNDFHVFEYDTWGHQEDLQRRSFLETLTTELINEKLLDGECYIYTSQGKTRCNSWRDKLNYLLASKFETETIQYPTIGSGVIAAFLSILGSSISQALGAPSWLIISLIFLPFLIAIIFWLIDGIHTGKLKSSSYLFAIYQGKVKKNIEYKTICEKEPSVTEFKNWMSDVSWALEQNDKKLIIVYDNMDRLPASKVKELWSSIHTFFAEASYNNVWVIIPYDKEHLANAFGKANNNADAEAKLLTDQFINKTFPINYRVANPIISDFRAVFKEYLTDAFGLECISTSEKELIIRIFGILKPNPTIRDVITFINELVQQKKTWLEELPIVHIAIFVLTKDSIFVGENVTIANNILAGKYLEKIDRIMHNDDRLQESISAIAYNIDKENAKQIPLLQALKNLFSSNPLDANINSYKHQKHFIDILETVVFDEVDETMNNNVIKKLNDLDSNDFSNDENKKISKIWTFLAKQTMQKELEIKNFTEEHKILLKNNKETVQKVFCTYLCQEFQDFGKDNGAEYYETMSKFENFLQYEKIEFDINANIKQIETLPKVFIAYAEKAQGNHNKYKLTCNSASLNKHLIALLPDEMQHTKLFDYIGKDENYSLKPFCNKIEEQYSQLTKDNFYHLNYAIKSLTKNKPLNVKLDSSQVNQLYGEISEKNIPGYYDITAMALGYQKPANGSLDNKDIQEIAKRIEYYHDYGDLLKIMISWNNNSLREVLAELTTNGYGSSRANIIELLSNFDNIRTALKIEPKILLNKFSGWTSPAKEKVDLENLDTTVPYQFYTYSIETENELTNYIHSIVLKKMPNISSDTLFAQRGNEAFYWIYAAAKLIDGKILKTLPDNYYEFCKQILKDFSVSQSMPNNNVLTILDQGHNSKLTATIKDIASEFYNGRKAINPALFVFFEKYFRKYDRVKGKEGDFVRTVLAHVVKHENCRQLILNNDEFYIKTINNAGDDAEDFKVQIRSLCSSKQSTELTNFIDSINAFEDDSSSKG